MFYFPGNTWHYLSRYEQFKTGAASVYSSKYDSLYIYGGYNLNEVLQDFYKYNFSSSTWTKLLDNSQPGALFEHTMTMLNENEETSFVIFGGLNQFDEISNKLWHYSISEEKWTLKAKNSIIQPPGLSKHTLTLAGDYLYLFGGSLSHGEFSNQMYRIESKELTHWELIEPEGNMANLYITGHSMVYYEE